MQLLVQNTKMKKSSKNGLVVVNWTIPAFQSSTGLKTCPNAGLCAAGCYARSGTYRFSNVARAHEAKLALTQNDAFVQLMIAEINQWLDKKSVKHLKVRIHDAGDFYSAEYLQRWLKIMAHFENHCDRLSFYAYTKQVELVKSYVLPFNLTVIFSFGGKQDHLIDVNVDRHARVFETDKTLKSAGYVDGTTDDMVAANGKSLKVGLCYHGGKNYANTTWNKVA